MDKITKEKIKALLFTKNMLDIAFFEMIDKDIPDTNYEKIMIALRRAKQEIFSAEMNYLVKTGQISFE
jgi:hypothetical protein